MLGVETLAMMVVETPVVVMTPVEALVTVETLTLVVLTVEALAMVIVEMLTLVMLTVEALALMMVEMLTVEALAVAVMGLLTVAMATVKALAMLTGESQILLMLVALWEMLRMRMTQVASLKEYQLRLLLATITTTCGTMPVFQVRLLQGLDHTICSSNIGDVALF
ncbi:hypothetical protein PF011_g271 [Phytophthora fragariae]|uniref:Uncharacterized protein n=1 Tax=Phytophthora fragariae TaxID=53985 RepID=A0A6A3MQU9_9STRA|nr:hypothetical protein PF011_g271 [Phytophthora fragariae]